MSKPVFSTFVSDEFELISVFFALRSLQLLEICETPPMVLVPKSLGEEAEQKYPKLKVKNMIRKLGGDYKEGFPKKYNKRNVFRAAYNNLARRADGAMLYFAPTTIFMSDPLKYMAVHDIAVSRAPDDFWPKKELYGPTLAQMWGKVFEFAKVNPGKWIDASQPEEYWRRFPTVSNRMIYAKDPTAFGQLLEQSSKEMIEANIFEFAGQGRDLEEPTIAAVVMAQEGKILDVEWDIDAIAYDSFIQMMLRIRDEYAEKFTSEFLEFQGMKPLLKQTIDFKYLFYTGKIANQRSKLDEIEKNFGMERMNTLIERRNLNGKYKQLVREAKKELVTAQEGVPKEPKEAKKAKKNNDNKAPQEAKKKKVT